MPCVPNGADEAAEDDQQLHELCQSRIVKIVQQNFVGEKKGQRYISYLIYKEEEYSKNTKN
jgi:hypothetical protein